MAEGQRNGVSVATSGTVRIGACAIQVASRDIALVSGPLMDRIDLHVEVPAVPFGDLSQDVNGESSAAVRACPSPEVLLLFQRAIDRLGLSARAYHRLLKVARTIADLEGSERILTDHAADAIQYRTLDRRPS